MKFKVDENLPIELVGDLQAAGHEAQAVLEEGQSLQRGTLSG
jgi:predicted nuclease of predicted toxin-antitoxin system